VSGKKAMIFAAVWGAVLIIAALAGCKTNSGGSNTAPLVSGVANAAAHAGDDAPPADETGGFDGRRAFAEVAKQVGFGPRPSGSPAIAKLQEYIQSELAGYGCKVETDAFSADTPAGRLSMKNIVAKIPGDKLGILMLATHYDTKRLENFVGADDGASSTAVMLELARLLCPQHPSHAVWITFLDGEEAVKFIWEDPDNRYGSRQMAAQLAMSGDLKKIKALLLADMVGSRRLRFKREENSTNRLTDLVWSTAARLGYSSVFANESTPIEDDHIIFLKRGVPAVDVINFEIPYWHTTQDTLDKVSAKSLAVTGHVLLESVKQLQSK
jgi:glutaminyl-peptide cyclotransferase